MSIKYKTSIVLTNVKSQSRSLTIFFSLPDKKNIKVNFGVHFFTCLVNLSHTSMLIYFVP